MADIQPMPKRKGFQDLTGKTFNRLTVIGYAGRSNSGKASLWLCRCRCGNETTAQAGNLKSGSIQGCGCARVDDLTGAHFGRLEVISLARKMPMKWLCRCLCGVEKVILATHLRSGATQSCGCLALELRRRTRRKMVGERFGRLVVIRKDGKTPRGMSKWLCQCDCGNTITVQHGGLTATERPTRSCGCIVFRHGLRGTITYRSWRAMRERCHNPEAVAYSKYGGIGISVCEEWRNDFRAFLRDMGLRPTPEHTIDRYPDPFGNYEPGNCRWATKKEQARNRRNTIMLTLAGQTKPLAVWAELLGMKRDTLRKRLEKGWSHERILSTPTIFTGGLASQVKRRRPIQEQEKVQGEGDEPPVGYLF